jgi:two-component system, OmpR family, sensor histidine kinase BaeS
VAAVAVASGVVLLAAGTMVLTPADTRVVLAALTLGTGLGLLVAIGVTGPLTADLRQLAGTARRVADGDLSVRTGIERSDEVGELARSVDRMVDQLAEFERQRQRDEAARHRLLAAVGHDLRTPLATLQAAVEALQDGVAADPDRYLQAMATDVELLRGMVDDLLVLTGLEAGEVGSSASRWIWPSWPTVPPRR